MSDKIKNDLPNDFSAKESEQKIKGFKFIIKAFYMLLCCKVIKLILYKINDVAN